MASFESFLKTLGRDALKVLGFLGSQKGQAVVNVLETGANMVVGSVNPVLVAGMVSVENMVNTTLHKIFEVEATAAAVGAQSGTGAQKAAAVIASITPNIVTMLHDAGVHDPTAEQIQTVATAFSEGLTAIVNAMPAPTATA